MRTGMKEDLLRKKQADNYIQQEEGGCLSDESCRVGHPRTQGRGANNLYTPVFQGSGVSGLGGLVGVGCNIAPFRVVA